MPEGSVRSSLTRFARKGLKAGALLTCVAVLGGWTYETIGAWQDDRALTRVGRAVDIGGRTLNLACSGEGSPTVVLASGRTTPGFVWTPTARDIATFTRVCWYDRAGLGWSDPGPDPSWGDQAARDLHELLTRAGVKPPLVLVGHSFGGYIVRLYVEAYPGEVAGLVLVDAAHEDAGTIRGMPHRERPNIPRWMLHAIATGIGHLGFTRFMEGSGRERPDVWTPAEWDTLQRLRRRRTAGVAEVAEGPESATASLVRSAHAWERMPVVVLSQGRFPLGDSPGEQARREVVQGWIALQRELAGRASGSRFVLTDSGHGIPLENPAVIVEAVRTFVSDVRKR